MPSIEFDDDRPPRSRDELLATVRRDGLRRRSRRNGTIGGIALVLVMALAIPVVAGGGSDAPERKVATVGPADSPEEETTTTTVAVVDETTTTGASSTTTTLVCRNSIDPRCGPFRWDPEPGANEPLTVVVSFSPSEPKVGEEVTLTVTSIDPDGRPIVTTGCNTFTSFGDDAVPYCMGQCVLSPPPGYGPWSPPPKERGESVEKFTHSYSKAGVFEARFVRRSVGACAGLPYGSEGKGSVTITVTE